MRHVRIGAPGFILRFDMEKNVAETPKRMGALGFDGIEITGFFGREP